MENSRKAIIIGGNHHNTLGVIRSLGRKGIAPFVILTSGGESSFVLKSKYIAKSWTVKGSEAAIDLLLKEFSKEKVKPVVFVCHDVISSQLDLNHDRLKPFFVLPGCSEQGRITGLMNKKRMGEFASSKRLNVPQTLVLRSDTLASDSNLLFPCITKPVESRSGKKSEICVCNGFGQLKSFLDKNPQKDYLVQHFIKKREEFQLIGCSLRSGQDIVIPGVSVILRQPSTTNTGFLHYKELDASYKETVEKCKDFIRGIGYSGLFSMEFIRDEQGCDYFMEINFRNDGNTIAVANAGVNLPFIWYLFGCGAEYNQELQPVHDEYVMPEFAEMALYESGIVTKQQWKEDMCRATSYMDYDDDDPAPTNGWNNYKRLKRTAWIKRVVKSVIRMIR